MGHSPRVLVSEYDERLRQQLSRKLEASGFWVDSVGTSRDTLSQLEQHQYAAMTLSLVQAEQDALTFLHDLKILGIELPVLVTSLRSEHPPRAPRLMPHLASDLTIRDEGPEPEWVRKAADQARFIFAMKTATQRSRHFRPRILHLEPDAFSSGLVDAALRKHCDLVQINELACLQDALYLGPYDLVLLNPLFPDAQGEAALHQIAHCCPTTPIVMHTEYTLYATADDFVPVNQEPTQQGVGLVETLQNLILHGLEVPLCAHA